MSEMTKQKKFNKLIGIIMGEDHVDESDPMVWKSEMWGAFLKAGKQNINIGELAAAIESGKYSKEGDK